VSRAKTSTEVVSTSATGYEARVVARGHEITIDEPASDGGTDKGPTPTELLLAALASCYTLALRWAADRRSVELGRIQVTAVGCYERLRFSKIRLAVAAEFPPGEKSALLADASRVCYVSNTLAADVAVDVTVVAPAVDGYLGSAELLPPSDRKIGG
jgi:putative redox protein